MSTALGIAAVTALLRRKLVDTLQAKDLVAPLGGSVAVRAGRPDAEDNNTRLNLFLYRTKENPAMRNEELPRFDGSGRRISKQPLTLELYYAVSAYSNEDLHAEILLGAAMQAFHEESVFSRQRIQSLLQGINIGTLSLSDARLHEQLQGVRITPQNLENETYSQIWSAMQNPATPSAYYRVSVVLIEPDESAGPSFPVLQRNIGSTPNTLSPFPVVESFNYAADKAGSELGENFDLTGRNLEGSTHRLRLFWHRDPGTARTLNALSATATSIRFTLPNAPNDWPAGHYQAELEFVPDGASHPVVTNRMSFVLLPRWSGFTATRLPNDRLNVSYTLTPAIQPGQSGELILQSAVFPFGPFASNTSNIQLTQLETSAGPALVRVRIDGVESNFIDHTSNPPEFLSTAHVSIP